MYLEGRSVGWSLHSLYNELTEYPPEGYTYVTDKGTETAEKVNTFRLLSSKLAYNRLNDFFDYFRPFVYYLYYMSKKPKTVARLDLTYSSQHLIFRKTPWVVDMEHVGALAGYGKLELFKPVIEKLLASKCCKKIMPWSAAGKNTLFLNGK